MRECICGSPAACTLPKYLCRARDRAPRVPTSSGPRQRSGSIQARLTGLLRTVNAAPEGMRNDALHWAACRAGEMVAAGEVAGAERVADALAQVAAGTGLDPKEIRGTIRSGFAKSGVSV